MAGLAPLSLGGHRRLVSAAWLVEEARGQGPAHRGVWGLYSKACNTRFIGFAGQERNASKMASIRGHSTVTVVRASSTGTKNHATLESASRAVTRAC